MVTVSKYARIAGVQYHLPAASLTNSDLAVDFPEWSVEKIARKTGIESRRVAMEDEFASDLAVASTRALLAATNLATEDIDYLIVCTQSPDFYMPITAGLVHAALNMPSTVGATDINLGCSGYIYGLGLAKGLIESGQAKNVVLVTTDTYTKFLNSADKSVRTIFGDGAASTLLTGDSDVETMSGFAYGTDGSGGGHLIASGGLRPVESLNPEAGASARKLTSNGFDLYMNGPEIFNFTLRVVPQSVTRILQEAKKSVDDVDLYVFHQANEYMLEHLRKKMGIQESKFFVSLKTSGNTVSSSIPVALAEAEGSGVLKKGMTVMLLGFGVGLSWGGLLLTWT